MSIPAFAWAMERGATLKLAPADRLVLIYLADRANGALVCWPGQPSIERFTGLKNNTVRSAIRRLVEAQLIRVDAAPGLVAKYHILRPDTPANGDVVTPAKRHRVTPANGTGVAARYPRKSDGGSPPQIGIGDPLNREAEPPQMGSPTPANGTGEPSTNQVREPKTRAHAREEGSKDLSSGKKAEGTTPPTSAPPPPPPQTPTIAATQGRSDTYRDPNAPTRSSSAFLDDPSHLDALPCEIEQQVVRADVPETLGPNAANAFVHSLARNFQNNYPPRAPRLSPTEQIELCQPKPTIKPLYAPDTELRAARIALAQRAAARASPP
jgi:hypothetical protein